MKKTLPILLAILLPVLSLADGGTYGNAAPGAPIDQYDYTLIIAGVLILAFSAILIMRKKLKKA